MTDTLTLAPIENAQETSETIVFPSAETASSSRADRTVPLFVPREQLYYWTNRWQTGESNALRELDAGLGITFADGSSAARWLLAEDDEEE